MSEKKTGNDWKGVAKKEETNERYSSAASTYL
jgi:hypothetical protein